MSGPDELNRRVTRLESEMVKARADAAAARVLASGAARDVSGMRVELRARTQLLNALRETQMEQGKTLAQHAKELGGVKSEMRTGFRTLGLGQAKLVELLSAHLGRSDGSD